jgi:hypothetical protein
MNLVVLSTVEIVLLATLVGVLHGKALYRAFPAFQAYLWVTILSEISYLVAKGLVFFSILPYGTARMAYAYVYLACYLAGAILIFCVVYDLYRQATSALPGIQHLGIVIYRWSVSISAIMAVVALCNLHFDYHQLLLAGSREVVRCECILVLCLVTFFAFTAQTFGMSYGSRVFGISFGLGMISTYQLVAVALFLRFPTQGMLINFIGEIVQLSAISLWVVYFVKAEPQRRLVTVESTSPLIRWNEIAQLLNNPAGQVVVSQPDALMAEVHAVIEKAKQRGAGMSVAR